ncbi:hypothetical protein HRbin16_01577 [bacterium HR16]|nr:hypothetical protein HRbin16_01577 [bacterium HR16]
MRLRRSFQSATLRAIEWKQILLLIPLVLVPVITWKYVLWRERQKDLPVVERAKRDQVRMHRYLVMLSQNRLGIAIGKPLPSLFPPETEIYGSIPGRQQKRPLLLWSPSLYEGCPTWEPKNWHVWKQVLGACPDLHLVGVHVTNMRDAQAVRRNLRQLIDRLKHPRVGFALIANDEWWVDAGTMSKNPFDADQAILVDNNRIVRYVIWLKPCLPSEEEGKQIADWCRTLTEGR